MSGESSMAARRIERWRQEERAHQRYTLLPNGIGSHADRAAARARRHVKFWQVIHALVERAPHV